MPLKRPDPSIFLLIVCIAVWSAVVAVARTISSRAIVRASSSPAISSIPAPSQRVQVPAALKSIEQVPLSAPTGRPSASPQPSPPGFASMGGWVALEFPAQFKATWGPRHLFNDRSAPTALEQRERPQEPNRQGGSLLLGGPITLPEVVDVEISRPVVSSMGESDSGDKEALLQLTTSRSKLARAPQDWRALPGSAIP